MSARPELIAELRTEVLALEDDLRRRVLGDAETLAAWSQEHSDAVSAQRTSATWEAWVDERVTLAAVSWVLTTVFIRFCEDNALVTPVWIAGVRIDEALVRQQEFIRTTARETGDATDREWLLDAVEYLGRLEATRQLVDANAPLRTVAPSGDAVTRLLNFWRERGPSGGFARDLTDAELDTRFLGDIYQDISEDARDRYALLQTPEFVEEFILDRTLEPALNDRPLEGFKMIDPTCGSGHFLLGGFARLLDRWHRAAPGLEARERVQMALDAVHGVDLNPYAAAVARFRLTVAALQACGLRSLEDAPDFKMHLAAGDSLLHGDDIELDLGVEFDKDRVAATFAFATENLAALRTILSDGQYDCVVGNPPYIAVKDKSLNQSYRARFKTCKGNYALTVPFMEKFFSLAKSGRSPGWVGQITSNSFMKRAFGTKLVENYLPTKDLTLVVDSEGAWIPGHNTDGTPTAIMVGRNSSPSSGTVRCILGKGPRENSQFLNGSGPYWSSVLEHIDEPGHDDAWISVADIARETLASHPWSLSGGGAAELLAQLEARPERLAGVTEAIGYVGQTNADEVFLIPEHVARRCGLSDGASRPFAAGVKVRDFSVKNDVLAIYPYKDGELIDIDQLIPLSRWFWPFRTVTWNRSTFTNASYREAGRSWWEWHQVAHRRVDHPRVLLFAFMATHNHFAVDRERFLSNRSAPGLYFPPDETREHDHLALLGALNSSTACFWLKQKSQRKGGQADTMWLRTYEFTGTTLKNFPLPPVLPVQRGRVLDSLAQRLSSEKPDEVLSSALPSRELLESAHTAFESTRRLMIAQQEELDWEVYRLYGLIDEDLTYGGEVPDVALGERAFEIALACKVAAGDEDTAWFERHHSTPVMEIPSRWPADYQSLVQRRLDLIGSLPSIRLLEMPEFKRRWATEPWASQVDQTLRGWLLDRLEDRRFWYDTSGRPVTKSIAVLADEVARDSDLAGVLALWHSKPNATTMDALSDLLKGEPVPYLAAYRYNDSGLRKRAAWERTWELQRSEDAHTYNPAPVKAGGQGPIPVPPDYNSTDFRRGEYWSHRGKFDVPKERFILYPDTSRPGDPTAVLGWAGWDHAQQALALAQLILHGQEQDWSSERLIPLVAGIDQLLPWIRQWHAEPEDLYGGSPAAYFTAMLDEYLNELRITREDLRDWRPAATGRGRKATS